MDTNITLAEQDRTKLDGIVRQMIANKETDEDIQWVVNDFKQKYGGQEKSWYQKKLNAIDENLAKKEQAILSGDVNEAMDAVLSFAPLGATMAAATPAPVQAPAAKPLGGSRGLDILAGTIETPLAMATGAIGGLAGLAGSIGAGAIGKGDQAKQFREFTTDLYSYKPRSQSGQEAMGIIGTAMYPFTLPRKAGEAIAGEQGGNVADVLTMALAPKAIKTVTKAVKKVTPNALNTSNTIEKSISRTINEGIEKGIKPYVGKKTKYTRAQNYSSSAESAVKDIVKNKQELALERNGKIVTGELPQTLGEFSQAVEQSMDRVVKQYSNLADQAGQKGATINLSSTSSVLDDLINNKSLKIARPEIVSFADDLKTRLTAGGDMTPLEVQGLVKELNTKAKNFYADPATASQGLVYETLARKLRSSIADTLDDAGPQYKALRKQYGDYATIERDINRRWSVDNRKGTYGFFDLANIISAADLAQAIIRLDPVSASRAVAMQLTKWQMKRLNSPNHQIKTMFKNTEKLLDILQKRKVAESPLFPNEEAYFGNPDQPQIGYDPNTYKQPLLEYDWKAEANKPPTAVLVDPMEGRFRGKGLSPSTWSKDNIVGTRKGKMQTSKRILGNQRGGIGATSIESIIAKRKAKIPLTEDEILTLTKQHNPEVEGSIARQQARMKGGGFTLDPNTKVDGNTIKGIADAMRRGKYAEVERSVADAMDRGFDPQEIMHNVRTLLNQRGKE